MLVEIASETGLRAEIVSCGATLRRLEVPGADGQPVDVVLGFEDVEHYAHNDPSFGANVGRVANRIAGAEFELGGTRYALDANDGPNCLHGGFERWAEREWELVEQGPSFAVFALHSAAGDQGFPGEAEVRARYELSGTTLHLELTAEVSEPTLVNLTNHSYFNLNGHAAGSVLRHTLRIPAEARLAMDAANIPTGELPAVAGTAYDFRSVKTLGAELPDLGYDDCYIVSGEGMREMAVLTGDATGIAMTVRSNAPTVQLYTGNYLAGETGKGGHAYQPRDGVCLECAGYVDALHHPEWPSIIATPELPYRNIIELEFSVA